jgi:hypothetical protein
MWPWTKKEEAKPDKSVLIFTPWTSDWDPIGDVKIGLQEFKRPMKRSEAIKMAHSYKLKFKEMKSE